MAGRGARAARLALPLMLLAGGAVPAGPSCAAPAFLAQERPAPPPERTPERRCAGGRQVVQLGRMLVDYGLATLQYGVGIVLVFLGLVVLGLGWVLVLVEFVFCW